MVGTVALILPLAGCETIQALMPVRTETVVMGPDRATLSTTIREDVCQSFEPDGMDQGNRDAYSAFACDELVRDVAAASEGD